MDSPFRGNDGLNDGLNDGCGVEMEKDMTLAATYSSNGLPH